MCLLLQQEKNFCQFSLDLICHDKAKITTNFGRKLLQPWKENWLMRQTKAGDDAKEILENAVELKEWASTVKVTHKTIFFSGNCSIPQNKVKYDLWLLNPQLPNLFIRGGVLKAYRRKISELSFCQNVLVITHLVRNLLTWEKISIIYSSIRI